MPRGRGGRGGYGSFHEIQNFDGARGGGRGRGRGRGGRGGFGGAPNIRRPDLYDDMMEQVQELESEPEEFNFGLSFRTLGDMSSKRRDYSPPPYRGSRGGGRGDGRGSGRGSTRGQGRGGASYAYAGDEIVGPSGRGTAAKRARGSGLGFADVPRAVLLPGVRAVIDPSKLPDFGRPLLRPIIFVRSTFHATLFKTVDEVLQGHEIKLEEDPQEAARHHHDPALSHAPTSDRVAAVFGSTTVPGGDTPMEQPASTGDSEDNDMVIQTEQTTTTTIVTTIAEQTSSATVEQIEVELDSKLRISEPPADPVPDEELFVVDTTPSAPAAEDDILPIVPEDAERLVALGEDVIVYPPSRTATPAIGSKGSHREPLLHAMNLHRLMQPARVINESVVPVAPVASSSSVTIDSVRFSSPSKPLPDASLGRVGLTKLEQLQQRVKLRRAQTKLKTRSSSFGMLGAMLEETRMREQAKEKRGTRAKARKVVGDKTARGRDGGREGDSDLDWGTASDSDVVGAEVDVSKITERDEEEEPDASLASMDVDPELIDGAALLRFAKGLKAQQHITIDDLADVEKMRIEDEEDEEGEEDEEDEDEEDEEEDREEEEAESDEEEAIIRAEEQVLYEEDEESSDDDDDPASAFDRRLKAIRAKERAVKDAPAEDSEEDEQGGPSKADNDEAYLATIKRMLEENSGLLGKGKKKGKGKQRETFEAVFNGDFVLELSEDEFQFPERIRRKDRGKTFVDANLRNQWERDRAKKAKLKLEREAARAEAQLGAMSPRQAKQMGKRFLKDNRNKGSTTGEIITQNGRPPNLHTVEAEIRAFVRDLRRQEMALPPLDKETRARVHTIAQNFGLKSTSRGGGNDRFITLYRTTRTRETAQNEKKVARLVSGAAWTPGKPTGPRHREGDEVGKSAPKLNDTNLGFRLLQQMGWEDGDRIGLSSSGLEAPIAAFFKKSKLGLGATSGS